MLKVKISFCVFFILSAYMEKTRKVFKRLWRMHGKYLIVYGENGKWCYLWYTKSSLNTLKVFKRIQRMRGQNLCVHGEDA